MGAAARVVTSGDCKGVSLTVGDMCRFLETSCGVSTRLPCQCPVKWATASVAARENPAVVCPAGYD